ncbi:putative reverse transcriptase domain-containing protein, partial [Tanacetum coccineum]
MVANFIVIITKQFYPVTLSHIQLYQDGRAFMLGVEEARQDPNIVTGMDWLSNYKAEIIYHEKVVRILLPDDKVLRVLGDRPKEKARLLMSAKTSEKKQEIFLSSYQDNSRNSKTKVSFDQAYRLGERRSGYHQLRVHEAKSPTTVTQKCNTFDWGEEQENAFQTLKDKLCNKHVLALPDGPKDFVIYYDASGLGLGCVL